jgi:hypothetical protein
MHCDGEFAQAAEKSMRQYTALVETYRFLFNFIKHSLHMLFRLNTMPELYQSLKDSLETEKEQLDEVDIRTAKLLLEDFENSVSFEKSMNLNQLLKSTFQGVHLEKDKVSFDAFILLVDQRNFSNVLAREICCFIQ